MNKNKIREEINEQLSWFNKVIQQFEFGFTDFDGSFPLNFENIVKTQNDIKEIINEAFEVYSELNKLL